MAEKKDKIISTQANIKTNQTTGTLICIPKTYAIDEPKVGFDDKIDRYTLAALTYIRGNRIILGSLYLRSALMKDTVEE